LPIQTFVSKHMFVNLHIQCT